LSVLLIYDPWHGIMGHEVGGNILGDNILTSDFDLRRFCHRHTLTYRLSTSKATQVDLKSGRVLEE